MAENQGRSIWDVFSDVKTDSHGNGSKQIQTESMNSDKEAEKPTVSSEGSGVAGLPAKKSDKKKVKGGDSKKKHLGDSSKGHVLPSMLKFNEIRNKLKLSNDSNNQGKAEKKAKSPSSRSKKLSSSNSPTKKSPSGAIEKSKDILKGSDLRAKLDNILKRKSGNSHDQSSVTSNCETDKKSEGKPDLHPLSDSKGQSKKESVDCVKEATSSISSDPTRRISKDNTTNKEEIGFSDNKTIPYHNKTQKGSTPNVSGLKVSKREKRRPVKYSPEITKAQIPRQREKSTDSGKKSAKPKSRRKVDFNDSPNTPQTASPPKSKTDVSRGPTEKTPSQSPRTSRKPAVEEAGEVLTGTVEAPVPVPESPTHSDISPRTETPSPVIIDLPPIDCDDREELEESFSEALDSLSRNDEVLMRKSSDEIHNAEDKSVTKTVVVEMAMKTLPPMPACGEQVEVERLQNVPVQNLHRSILQGRGGPRGEHRRGEPDASHLTGSEPLNSPTVIDLTAQGDSDDIPEDSPPQERNLCDTMNRNSPFGALGDSVNSRASNDQQKSHRPSKVISHDWRVKAPVITGMLMKDIKSARGADADKPVMILGDQGDRVRTTPVPAPALARWDSVRSGSSAYPVHTKPVTEEPCAPLDLSKSTKPELPEVIEIDFDKPLDLSVKKKPTVSTPAPGVAYEDPNSCLPTFNMGRRPSNMSARHIFGRSQASNMRKVSPVRPHIGGKPVVRGNFASPAISATLKRMPNNLSPGMKSRGHHSGVSDGSQGQHVSQVYEAQGRAKSAYGHQFHSPGDAISGKMMGRDRKPCSSTPPPLLNIPTYHQRSKEDRKRKKSSEPLKISIPGEPESQRPIVPMAQVKPNNMMSNITGELSINLDRPAPATVTIHGPPRSRSPKKSRRRMESVSSMDKRLLQQMLEGTSPPQLSVTGPSKLMPMMEMIELPPRLPLPSPQMPILSPHPGGLEGGPAEEYAAGAPEDKHSPALPSTLAAIRRRCTSNSREASPSLTSVSETSVYTDTNRGIVNTNSALASLLVSNTLTPLGGSSSSSVLQSVDYSTPSPYKASSSATGTPPKSKSPKVRKSPKSKSIINSIDKDIVSKCSQVSAFIPTCKSSRKAMQKSRRSFYASLAFNFVKHDDSQKFDIGNSIYYKCNILGKLQTSSSTEDGPESEAIAAEAEIPEPPKLETDSVKVNYTRPEYHDESVPSFNIPFSDWKDHLYKYKCERLKMHPKLVYVPPKNKVPSKFEDLSPLVHEAISGQSTKKMSSIGSIDPVNVDVLAAIRSKCPPTRRFGMIGERRPWVLEEKPEVMDPSKSLKKGKRKSEVLETEAAMAKQSKLLTMESDKPRIYLKITNGKITATSVEEPSIVSTLRPVDAPGTSSAMSPDGTPKQEPVKGQRKPYKQRFSLVRLEENFPSHMEEVRAYSLARMNNTPPESTNPGVVVTLERAVRATDALGSSFRPVPVSLDMPSTSSAAEIGQDQENDNGPQAKRKKRMYNDLIPVREDNALADLVKRVKSQILKGSPTKKDISTFLGTKDEDDTPRKKVLRKENLPACKVLLNKDDVVSPKPSDKAIKSRKPSPSKTPTTPGTSVEGPSNKGTAKKKTPSRERSSSLSKSKGPDKEKKSFEMSRESTPEKPASPKMLRSCRTPGKSLLADSLQRSPAMKKKLGSKFFKSRKARAAAAAAVAAAEEEAEKEREKKKRRSILDELANSDGYVAEKKQMKFCENLYADPSKLGREERALQRALMQFSEMQVKQDYSKETKRTQKAQPPPPSQARQKAQQLKKKAMKGSTKSALSRPLRRTIEFRPQRPTTRLQAAAVDGKKSSRHYHKDDAYEKALDRDQERREKIREKRRSHPSRDHPEDEDPEITCPNNESDREQTVKTEELTEVKSYKKKSQGFVFNWRSKYLGKSSLQGGAKKPALIRKSEVSPMPKLKVKPEAHGGSRILHNEPSYPVTPKQADVKPGPSGDHHEKLDIPAEVKKIGICHNTGETILHKAARLGYKDVVLWCAQHNYVDVKERDNAGYSALHESCVPGHIDIASYLLEYGADVNVASRLDGVRPLHDAVENDHLELVRLLLSAGADPTLSTYSGKTVLKLARTRKMREFLQAYLRDMNGAKGMERESPIEFDFVSKDPDVLRQKEAEVDSDEEEEREGCGFNILADIPEEDEDGAEIEFEFSDVPPIQSYHFTVDESRGPENFLLLSEVLFRLNVSDCRLCSMHGALEIEHITWDEFSEKLGQSQIPLTPPEDLRPYRGNEMMDFVKLDRKLKTLLGADIETLPIDGAGLKGDKGGAREAGDSRPPLGSYISRTGSGDKSIKRNASRDQGIRMENRAAEDKVNSNISQSPRVCGKKSSQ